MKNLSLFIQVAKIVIFTVALILIFSCEKVIEIDIKDAEIQTVVEAYVNSTKGDNQVILSKSANFYEANNFPMVTGADVVVTTENGLFQLQEIKEGIYQHPDLGELSNDKYKLTININGKTIRSESIMPNLVPVDSVSFEEDTEGSLGGGGGPGSGGPGGGQKDKSYKLYLNFTDPEKVNNYYKIRVTKSFSKSDETAIFNDALFDGRNAKLPLSFAMPGDTVIVYLSSIDKQNYEYFRLLEANDMGAFTTSVGNPVSNVSGENVIGVFGANALSTDTLILPVIPPL